MSISSMVEERMLNLYNWQNCIPFAALPNAEIN